MGEVVNVFRGTCEVNEFGYGRKLGKSRDPLFQKILNRFNVMIGCAFYVFDSLRIRFGELA